MLWFKEFVKSDWGGYIIYAVVVIVVGFSVGFYFLRVDRQPTQTSYVEVVNMRWRKGGRHISDVYYATFKFADGTEKEFNVINKKIYDSFHVGDKGILTYKQLGDGIGPMTKRFVSFEKDEAPVKELARNPWYLANLKT